MKPTRLSVGFCSTKVIDPSLAMENNFKFLSEKEIFATAIRATFAHFDNFPDLKIEPSIFERNDTVAVELLNRNISIRRKKIAEVLVKSFSDGCAFGSEIVESDISVFCSNMDKLYALGKIIRESVSPLLLMDDYIVCGRNLPLDFPTSFEVSTNEEDDFGELLSRAIRKRELFSAIAAEQEALAIPRKSFCWKPNPFLAPLRQMYSNAIQGKVKEYNEVFGEFDLSMQLLMHLGAYGIEDVWSIPAVELEYLKQLPDSRQACEKFEELLQNGTVAPKNKLILGEISRLAEKLAAYLSNLSVNLHDNEIKLPSRRMSNLAYNPFDCSGGRAEIDLSDKEYMDGPYGKIMFAKEKLSGKRIVFSPIPHEISTLYSLGFCNLHYANAGEIAVYGAFLEGDDLPFAYSSYGKVSYNYTKEMLSYMGFAEGEIIESSRAWNAAWAPENTMSVLFSYSQERLKEKLGNKLAGILTAINPNLGFSASAFRGIHFEIVSLKPTIFSYQLSSDKKPTFGSRGEIAKNLGVSAEDLAKSEYYVENQIPFLPTIEYLYLYDKEGRKKLKNSPIYVVSENDYLHNR